MATEKDAERVDALAVVTWAGSLDMQVCVPTSWTDEQAVAFAERQNPCGTVDGWRIRREGHEALRGHPERRPCAANPRFVHIMLDA